MVLENSSRIVAANESSINETSPDPGVASEAGIGGGADESGYKNYNQKENIKAEKTDVMETGEENEETLKENSNTNNNKSSSNDLKNSSNTITNNRATGKATGARSGKKGKANKELFLSTYEKELLEWALGGFLPHGPVGGLVPTGKDQIDNTKVVEDEKTLKVFIMKNAKGGTKGMYGMGQHCAVSATGPDNPQGQLCRSQNFD